ncbi:MAG: Type 1 glutamine amidotransferase-like domain-containing protein [Planctomycetes bacterium]|nr:Type 1 glutamine amidotransferase-like domain-containing protein [Planctomycetota bacterium]
MATTAPVFLVAWPDFRRRDVNAWHSRALGATGARKPRVAFVGAASGDDRFEERWIAGYFRRRFGIVCRPVAIESGRTSRDEARRLLSRANLVYLGGGDPLLCVRAVERAGVADLLRRRRRAGTVFFGISAGAIALGPCWPKWPDPPNSKLPEDGARLVPCLGIHRAGVFDMHSEDDGWPELHACRRLTSRSARWRRLVACGVPKRGAALVEAAARDGDHIEILGERGPVLGPASSITRPKSSSNRA